MKSDQLILLSGDLPVNHSARPEKERDSKIREDRSCFNIFESLERLDRNGSSGKMFKVRYHPKEVEPLEPSSGAWLNSGILSAGECWTLDVSESLNLEKESFLSEVLEDQKTFIPSFLGRTLAAGMIRRIPDIKKVDPTILQAIETARDNDQPFQWSSMETDILEDKGETDR